jgi:uncharacterized cupredoxin-like copper-binding protein
MIAIKTVAAVALATAAAAVGAVNAVVKDVTIVARDYAFEIPDTLQSGYTRFTLKNLGPELHHVQMMRLEEGKTLKDVFTALQAGGPPPAWAKDVGGPNTPVPGGESRTSLVLKPGRYGIICFIPSPDGKPHVMKGMAKEFVVVGKEEKAAAPAVTSEIELKDYDFVFSKPLVAGKNVIRVVNRAEQSHEVVFVQLAPGKTPQDVIAWVDKPDGPPPGAPIGGTTGMQKDGENVVELDLKPGEYGMICFIPDHKDGKPHFVHGMVKTFTVK